MSYDAERAKILEMIQQGKISAEEALQLLNAVQGTDQLEAGEFYEEDPDIYLAGDPLPDPLESESVPSETFRPTDARSDVSADIRKWKSWWLIPFWVGTGVTTLGGLLMFFAYQANGFSFWFACSLFLFLIGAGLMALFWGTRNSPWLHIRVNTGKDEFPRRIALSFPLPIRLTVWGLRIFRGRIPNLDMEGIDDLVLALKDSITPEDPLFVDVNDEVDGESVQIFIG